MCAIRPDGRDDLYLLSVTGELVISSRVVARVKIEVALDAALFGAESVVKQLSQAYVALLVDQEVKLWRILLTWNGEYCFWIDVVKPCLHRVLE